MPSYKQPDNLMRRDDALLDQLMARELTLRADSLDEATRSVEAVFASENMTRVRDPKTGEVFDEVLLLGGRTGDNEFPLLNNHQRTSTDEVLGTGRFLRDENGLMVGRLFFADDEISDRNFRKVKARHIRGVSVGYHVDREITLRPNETRTVNGRSYTARDLPLRIAVAWHAKEVSLTAIPADRTTKIRTQNQPTTKEGHPMNLELRKYLESIGLRHEATEDEAREFAAALTGEQRTRADEFLTPTAPALAAQTADPAAAPAPTAAAATAAPVNADQIRADAAAEERRRIAAIENLVVEGVSPATVRRAIDEGWTRERSAEVFLGEVRQSRSAPPNAGPAIHTRSHEADCNRSALEAALIVRSGVAVDSPHFTSPAGRGARLPEWLRADVNADVRQRAMEAGDRYRDISLFDMCREALRIDGVYVGYSRADVFEALRTRAATSVGGTISNVFTTNVSAMLLEAYMSAPDSTAGWVRHNMDIANFQTNERPRLEKAGALSKHARAGTAEPIRFDDNVESYKIARYSAQFVLDEQDIIDDRFGSLGPHVVAEMGESAAQLGPDLVYSILIGSPNMRDSVALFHAATHANLNTTSALTKTTLEVALKAMATQTENGRPIANNFGRFVIVPEALRYTILELLRAATVVVAGDTDLVRPSSNVLSSLGLEARVDPRLDNGVTDPSSGTAHSGSATTWYVANNNRNTIEVGHLRGTGGAPQIRSGVLTQGQWGMYWDINKDIGAKALDWRSFQKSTA